MKGGGAGKIADRAARALLRSAGGPAWTAWGRFATAGFVADVDEVRMDGDVTTGFLGADVARARWLAGVLARAFELPLLGRLARMEDVRAHAGNAVGKPRAGSGRPRTTPCFWPRWRRSSRSARSGRYRHRPRRIGLQPLAPLAVALRGALSIGVSLPCQ